MRDKLALHQFVLFGVLIVLTLWKLLTGNLIFGTEYLWWLLGGILGFLFVFTDRFIYSFLMKPNEAMALRIRDLFGERRFSEGMMVLLTERAEQRELVMRSFLFLIVWFVMGFFAASSVAGPFARGFMLGIGTHLVFDLVHDYKWNKDRFNLWFWQIKRELTFDEKRWFVILTVIIYVLLALTF